MARKKATPSLGVDWHLPARNVQGYYKRRFATTTQASSDLIETLAADGLTWSQMVEAILFDPEAKAVAQGFVDAGHSDVPAHTHLGHRAQPAAADQTHWTDQRTLS